MYTLILNLLVFFSLFFKKRIEYYNVKSDHPVQEAPENR